MAKFRVVGISFDHMHMGDLLRLVHDHPDAEIAGIFDPDPAKMARAIATFAIPPDRVFTDFDACMRAANRTSPSSAPRPPTMRDYTERLAAYGVPCLCRKALRRLGRRCARDDRGDGSRPAKLLAINWPLAWVASHVTAKRLIDEGVIGELIEVHFYGGNRGPLYHLADKVEVSPEEVERAEAGLPGGTSAPRAAAACWITSATARRSAPGT